MSGATEDAAPTVPSEAGPDTGAPGLCGPGAMTRVSGADGATSNRTMRRLKGGPRR
jgi:hypothetical protein